MSKTYKIILYVLSLLAVASVTFLVTVIWTTERVESQYVSDLSNDVVDAKMRRIHAMLENYFIDDYDPQTVQTAAADGAASAMITATGDPWSYYISAEDMSEYEELMTNSYVGIGVTIEEVHSGMKVMGLTAGGPAEEAGVLIGDILTHVEGQSAAELGLDETKKLVQGKEGSYVNLRFDRDGTPYDVQVQRRTIISDVATMEMLDGKIALITIKNFDLHCAEQTLECIDLALAQNASALLFDVRFNGGGLKDEMVPILDVLLPEGTIFSSVDYLGTEETDYSDAAFINLPMAVLVNADSYSAAEFFAAALQQYDMAQVIGVQTSGKGNFQYTLPLGDGSAVALSVGKYFMPDGTSLTGVGVTPDVEMDLNYDDYVSLYYGTLSHEEDEQLQAALEVLK